MNTYGNASNKMFLYRDGKGATNLSRIRMGLSALNAQRKKYHFIPDGKCESCNAKSENSNHYFLSCPTYAVQRQQLLQDLNRDVPTIMRPLNNFETNKKSANELVKVLIFGVNKVETDKTIFTFVQIFIENTERF